MSLGIIERVKDISPEQLESLLLHTYTEPYLLRALGQEALLENDSALFDVATQVCFDKASNPNTVDQLEYAQTYSFLCDLVQSEITIVY